jgi:uncharacterized membrane protein
MKRFATMVAGALLGAVMIHILVVLAYPRFGGEDVWAAMEGVAPELQFSALPMLRPGDQGLPGMDPGMMHVLCRFRLGDGPVRVTATLDFDFWSAAIFDHNGRNLFSLNDRGIAPLPLDLVLIRPEHLRMLQNEMEPLLDEAVPVDIAIDRGLVLIRAFVPDPTLEPAVREGLATARCGSALEYVGGSPPLPS